MREARQRALVAVLVVALTFVAMAIPAAAQTVGEGTLDCKCEKLEDTGGWYRIFTNNTRKTMTLSVCGRHYRPEEEVLRFCVSREFPAIDGVPFVTPFLEVFVGRDRCATCTLEARESIWVEWFDEKDCDWQYCGWSIYLIEFGSGS